MEGSEEWITAGVPESDDIIDIVDELQAILAERGTECVRRGDGLRLEPPGLTLSPRGLSVRRPEAANVRTISIVRVTHPAIRPAGLYEYQHGAGEDLRQSLRYGFDQWARTDLPVLCDACLETPEACTMLQMRYPAKDGRPERGRRVILGPTLHAAKRTDAAADGSATEEVHPFCPCCMTTNCMDVLKPLFEADETLGVRLFAARDESGQTSADCRVNGEDFEEGMAALRAYAETWPGRGFEFRKQYVLFQTEG